MQHACSDFVRLYVVMEDFAGALAYFNRYQLHGIQLLLTDLSGLVLILAYHLNNITRRVGGLRTQCCDTWLHDANTSILREQSRMRKFFQLERGVDAFFPPDLRLWYSKRNFCSFFNCTFENSKIQFAYELKNLHWKTTFLLKLSVVRGDVYFRGGYYNWLPFNLWYMYVITWRIWDIWGFCHLIYWVVVSKIFFFYPYLGRWSNLTNIFQMGWNHQLVVVFIQEKHLTLKNMQGRFMVRCGQQWQYQK